MSHENHRSSRVVYIRRAGMSIAEDTAEAEQNKEIKPYFDASYRAIGSYWPKDSQRPGTGLTLTEENILMPYLLNIPITDTNFRSISTQYFHDITTKVEPLNPDGTGGTKLQIGLENNGNEMDAGNLPLNVSDYVRYKHAISHPWVGASFAEQHGNRLKVYYIFDPAKERTNKIDSVKIKDDAIEAYLSIKDDKNKVLQYLSLLNADVEAHRGAEAVELRKLATTKPEDFLEVHTDKSKNARYLIKKLVLAKVLEIIGTRIIIIESGFQIGNSEKEAIAYLRDPANNSQLATFQALAQDFAKKAAKADTLEDIEAGDDPTPSINLTKA